MSIKEGRYTKISAVAGVIAIGFAIWQFLPESKANYSGDWQMIIEIEDANSSKFKGMNVEWELHFTHTDNSLAGNGEKISINSARLKYKERTSLTFQGVLKDDFFVITYIEKGKKRQTNGVFKGQFVNDTEFKGEFTQTASDSKGKISGHKK